MTSTQSDYERILGLASVKPANTDLFMTEYLARAVYPEAYPGVAPMVPATEAPVDAPTVRAELNDFLMEALGAEAVEVQDTLALFDDPKIQERVPDPRLRAAFVLLNLTVAAPYIDIFMTSSTYSETLDWIETGRAYTEATGPGPDGKTLVGMSDVYRYEHFALVAPQIAHSLTHHDDLFSYPEDVMALTVATVSYLQLVDLQPSIAYSGTELSRINNTFGMALLNSHQPGSAEIQPIVPGGTSVLPGSSHDAEDFWSLIATFDGQSPTPPDYALILQNLLSPDVKLPDTLMMNRSLVELVGGNISEDVLGEPTRVRLWVLFTMTSVDEIAALLDLPRVETLERFDLTDIEAVVAGKS